MTTISVMPVLALLDSLGVKEATFSARQFDEEYLLITDDKDWVTFHKYPDPPFIVSKLEVCDYLTTNVKDDWYMTVNYHS